MRPDKCESDFASLGSVSSGIEFAASVFEGRRKVRPLNQTSPYRFGKCVADGVKNPPPFLPELFSCETCRGRWARYPFSMLGTTLNPTCSRCLTATPEGPDVWAPAEHPRTGSVCEV